MKAITVLLTILSVSLGLLAQTDDSWRELSQASKDSIDAIYGESYAGESEKILAPLLRVKSRLDESCHDSISVDFHELSTLGGEATFFYHEDQITVIRVVLLNESNRDTIRFYFKNDSLFLIQETEVVYNVHMLEEGFDDDKSTVYHTNIVVRNNEVIRYIQLEDCGAPNDPTHVENQRKNYLGVLSTALEKYSQVETD